MRCQAFGGVVFPDREGLRLGKMFAGFFLLLSLGTIADFSDLGIWNSDCGRFNTNANVTVNIGLSYKSSMIFSSSLLQRWLIQNEL